MKEAFITGTQIWDMFFTGILLLLNLLAFVLYSIVWIRCSFKERYIFGIMAVTAAIFVFHNAFFFTLQLYPNLHIMVFPPYINRALYVAHMILGLISIATILASTILLTRFAFMYNLKNKQS